jgi:hypothetical protein
MKNWRHIDNLEKGIVNELSDFIDKLEYSEKVFLPDLRQADNLYIFSDYSANKDQQLISYSILILDDNSVNSFVAVQKHFWEVYTLESRIIEYKKLNDGPTKRALVPFLQLCNKLNGLLLTIIIHKNTKSIYTTKIPEYLQKQIITWGKKAVREKFLRLREFLIFILNGLGREDQNVLWITDNDEIVANNLQLDTANTILKETLYKHLDFRIGSFELKTLDADSRDKCFEKLCSLTDLAAGGLVDFLGHYHNANIFPKEGEIATPIIQGKLKVNPITNWLSKNEEESALKKITIKINEKENDKLFIEAFRFPEFI